MFNYMQGELYKIMHRRCTKIFFGLFGIMAFFLNYLFKVTASGATLLDLTNEALGLWMMLITGFGWFLVFMLEQIVYSNEGKAGTLKNSVSYGFSRSKIYVARFLVEIFFMLFAILVLAAVMLLGHLVFFGAASAEMYRFVFQMFVALFFMWLGALAMAHALAMCFTSNSVSTTIYMMYFFGGDLIFEILRMIFSDNDIIQFICDHEIYNLSYNTYMSGALNKGITSSQMLTCIVVGLVYLVVCFLLGWFFFKKKEVK